MQKLVFAALSAVSLALGSLPALAFSDESAPSGPGVQSQFSDPDEGVENLANGASGQNGTEISTGGQLPAGASTARTPAASAADAEPVNPGWPAWMVWHQQ
jgi:hypothetical protein